MKMVLNISLPARKDSGDQSFSGTEEYNLAGRTAEVYRAALLKDSSSGCQGFHRCQSRAGKGNEKTERETQAVARTSCATMRRVRFSGSGSGKDTTPRERALFERFSQRLINLRTARWEGNRVWFLVCRKKPGVYAADAFTSTSKARRVCER